MKRFAVLAAVLISSGSPLRAQQAQDYAWAFPLVLPSGDAGTAWRVELTPEVYARVHDAALRDIAVFNAEGRPVPTARIVEAGPATIERDVAVPLLALPASTPVRVDADLRLVVERDAGGRLRRIEALDPAAATAATTRDWIVDASAIDGAIEQVQLNWDAPADGVVARFELGAGDDLQAWRPLPGGSVFALRQGEARLDRRDLATGGVRAKYLRLHRVDDGPVLDGLRATLRHVASEGAGPTLVWIDAPVMSAAGAAADGVERHDYALPAALPLDRVRVDLASDNALAEIVLYAVTGERRDLLARATAFRLRTGEDLLNNGDIEISPSTRVGTLRIESRTPLARAPRVQVAFRPDRFVFLAEGTAPFTLAVGSARAVRADYPIEPALASLRARLGARWQPPAAMLGSGRASGGDAALRAVPPPLPWRRWLLWGVLVAGALLIGTFALSLLRERR